MADPGLMAILGLFSFWTGATIGSFLNVVAWRVPRGESIVSPPSHCPKCSAPIRWWQNVPILSWLALRGRCACCREPISPRYILVELLCGLLFLAAFLHFWDLPAKELGYEYAGRVVPMVVWWTWISLMLAGSLIDFDHKLLPDFVTVGGMVLGIAHSTLNSLSFRNFSPEFLNPRMYLPLAWSLSGLAFGFGLLWLVRYFGSKAFRREAMGLGDVFLMGAVGALFGPVSVLVTLVLSSVFGSVVGLAMIALSKTRLGRFTEIPYGPYICLGCLAWMFWGRRIVGWYMAGVSG